MLKKNLFSNKIIILFTLALLLLVLGWGRHAQAARAAQLAGGDFQPRSAQKLNSPLADAARQNTPTSQWNPNCVMCHQSPDLNGVTMDSLQISLMVDVAVLNQSVHGEAGLQCVSCHTLFTNYPHLDKEQVTCEECHDQDISLFANLPYENLREMETQLNESCRNCHAAEFSAESMHTPVEESGQFNTPLCTDCHGGHNVQHPTDPPERVVYTCAQCHTAVYEDFQAGQHNSADPDTQTCIDCHAAHHVPPAPAEPLPTPQPAPIDTTSSSNSFVTEWSFSCTMCHGYLNLVGKAQDSSTVSLTVTDQVYSQSVHATAGLGCAACHETITGYPHQDEVQVTCSDCHSTPNMDVEIVADLPHASARALSIEMNEACQTCHEKEHDASTQGMHSKSLAMGNLNAPLCTDCHGDHNIQPVENPRAAISQQCAKCHDSAYSSYQASVHGEAVEQNGSADAATCVDCHGVHDINGPHDSTFRNESVVTCIRCHSDQEIMAKYGIESNLFDPNVDNFHGQPVSLFSENSNNPDSNAVACYDCHGIHSIRSSDDPVSSVHAANLQTTCQQCHPDAGESFAAAGLAHGKPAAGSPSVLGWVSRFYTIFIFSVFILMMIYILLDVRKRRRDWKELTRQALAEE